MTQTTWSAERLRSWGCRLLLLYTILSVTAANIYLFQQEFVGPNHVAKTAALYNSDTLDVWPLLTRAGQCTTFLQTRSYWHEDYTPNVPFYRPLSLTVYWAEYHAFGAYYFNRWTCVSIALELCFCFLLAIYVRQMTGSLVIALCSVIVYAGFRQFGCPPIAAFSMGNQGSPSFNALAQWKDQPTFFADCSILGAAVLALRKKWIAALCIAVIGILFKESAWIVFAFVFLTLVFTGKVAEIPKWVYFATLFCIAIPITARHFSGMGYIGGIMIGKNRYAEERYLFSICGAYIKYCLQNEEASELLGTGLYCLVIWKRKSLFINSGIALALFAAAAIINDMLQHVSFPISMTMLLDPTMKLWYILVGFCFTAACHWLIKLRELGNCALKFFLLAALSALSFVSATQIRLHELNLCFAMQSAIVATVWVAGIRLIEQKKYWPWRTS